MPDAQVARAQQKSFFRARAVPACKWALTAFIFTISWPLTLLFAIVGFFAGEPMARTRSWRPAEASMRTVLPAPAWAAHLGRTWTRRRGWAALVLGSVGVMVLAGYRSPYAWIGGATFGAGLAALSGSWKSFGSAILIPSSLPFASTVLFARRWRVFLIMCATAVAALQLSNTFYTQNIPGFRQSSSTVGGPTLSVDHNGHWVHGYQSTTTTYTTPYLLSATDTNFGVLLVGLLGFAVAFRLRRTPAALEPTDPALS